MKIFLPFLSMVLLTAFVANAVDAKKTTSAKDAASEKKVVVDKNAARNYDFEDLLVKGKFNFSDEAVTTVEDDKVFGTLIGIRSDFKDRIEKSLEKH